MSVLVCDLDGTLVNVRERDYQAYVYALARIGESPIDIDTFWDARRVGKRIVEFVAESASPEQRDAVLKAFVDIVETDDYLAMDPLFDDALPFLTDARAAGWTIVICTLRRQAEAAARQVERLGLLAYVDDLSVAPQGVEFPKAETLKRYLPERTVMVGDTDVDIKSAQHAGATAYAVTTGVRGRTFLERLGPDAIVDSLTEVLPLLKGEA